MLLRKRDPHEMLHETVEEWQEAAASALANRKIRAAVGKEKAARLAELSAHAGAILVDAQGEIRVVPSRNGLHFVPVHDDISEDFAIEVEKGAEQFKLPVQRVLSSTLSAVHVISDSYRDMPDFILFPVSSPKAVTRPDKEAASVHELVHADQYRQTTLPLHLFTNEQGVTRQEAEAYMDTFRVYNAHWGGILSVIPSLNAGNNDLSLQITGDDKHGTRRKDLLDDHGTAALACRLVSRNLVHGYEPYDDTLPPDNLVTEYRRLNALI